MQTWLYLDKDFNFFIIITTSAAICCNRLLSLSANYVHCVLMFVEGFKFLHFMRLVNRHKQLVSKSWECCWNCQNLDTNEGHSPETSEHLLRFRHFQQHSQLLFSYCNFFHFISNWYVSFNFHRITFVIKRLLYC